MFCFLVSGQGTATVLANIFIGLNNQYSGFIASPALLTKNIFFAVQYWFVPDHYVYEGMVSSLFGNDILRDVIVPPSSFFYEQLKASCEMEEDMMCKVTVNDYFEVYFDGLWSLDSRPRNIGVLIFWSVCVRMIASLALKYLKYSGK